LYLRHNQTALHAFSADILYVRDILYKIEIELELELELEIEDENDMESYYSNIKHRIF